MKRLRETFDSWSRLKYAVWRISRSQASLPVRLASGPRMELRPLPYGDLFCASEVFLHEVYRCPEPELLCGVETIADIGANIGLSCIYWASLFAQARITAIEPHPAHLEVLRRNLRLNGLTRRVTVFAGAAGVSDGEAELCDASLCSSLVPLGYSGALKVSIFDIFKVFSNQAIDLMKMDIEGYEYTILQDTRFGALLPRILVMEWHNTEDYPNGRDWSVERLTALGYRVRKGNDSQGNTGILWAFRPEI